ncbi:MAG: tetratricopeptide repeat protein, partial [Phycisphaerales bacterium]
VCLQCHAQPASEVTTRVTHPSRTIYSYRPGEPLSEYLTVLDFDAPNWHGGEDRFDINHHPYRLYQSRCHLRSENGLNCLTCHDPHRRIEPVERASWYRGKCLECHVIDDCNLTAMQIASGNTTLETTDCTVCHMPQRRTQDVIQITMTDHLIQRTPAPEAQRLAARTEHGPPESLTFHLWQPNESMDPRELEMLQGIAYSADGRAEAADHFAQTGKILETMPVEAQYYNAYAQGLAERLGPGISTAERILAVDPDIARVHNLLAQYASASQDTAKALQHSERAVALDPEAARYHFGLGLVRYMRGQVLPAIESFERTIELQPHHVGALANLGHAYRTAGRNDDALATYLRVLAVEPASLDIYIDVAYLYLDDGDGDNAELWIRRGSTLDRAGNIFDAALAVAMIVQQRFDDALLAAEDGRAKGADEGTLRMVQAIAYHALGQDRQVQIALAQLRATADGRVGEQAQLLRRVLEPLLPSSGQ